MELLVHILLLVVVSVVIVLLGAFHAETDDQKALRSVPRRLGVFLLSCAGVAAVMLACERLFAWAG
jgi:hypothetical protein